VNWEGVVKFLVAVVLLLAVSGMTPCASADVYKYEDVAGGSTHLTDDPTDARFKVFEDKTVTPSVPPKESRPENSGPSPIADEYLFDANAGEYGVWAVRTTNVEGQYFWYMGAAGKRLAIVKDRTVYVGDSKFFIKDNDVVMSENGQEIVLVRGTMGYFCYNRTILHAVSGINGMKLFDR